MRSTPPMQERFGTSLPTPAVEASFVSDQIAASLRSPCSMSYIVSRLSTEHWTGQHIHRGWMCTWDTAWTIYECSSSAMRMPQRNPSSRYQRWRVEAVHLPSSDGVPTGIRSTISSLATTSTSTKRKLRMVAGLQASDLNQVSWRKAPVSRPRIISEGQVPERSIPIQCNTGGGI